MFGKLLERLSKKELIRFIVQYDKYVQEFFETHEDGMIPVCAEEFFDNDYQYIVCVGDYIKIVDKEDEDLWEWRKKQTRNIFEVREVDEESQLFWLKGCEYAIPIDSGDWERITE